MGNKPKPCAIVFAKSVAEVARFYEEMMSMSNTHADHEHVVLDSECFQVIVHAIAQHIADTISITTPPKLRDNASVKLSFPISAIDVARARAPSLGGLGNPKESEWEGREFRACDGYDPEGNVVQVREGGPNTRETNTREKLIANDADLSESHFFNTQLEKSTFVDVTLRQASFSDVNLSGASFLNVNLADVSIANANLAGMKIDGVLVSELILAYQGRAK